MILKILIDEAKPARFSPGKIMIEKDVLMTVIEELRKQIPGEIERSHKIILNKDAILEDARVKSQQMIDQAARDAGELIDQNEVVEMAKMRANEIETHAKDTARSVVHNANEEADQIRAGALRYINEIMEDVQGYVASVKEAQESVFNQLLSALDSDLASIKNECEGDRRTAFRVSIPQARTRTVEDFISDEELDKQVVRLKTLKKRSYGADISRGRVCSFLYHLKSARQQTTRHKEVIIHNNMTLRLIDIWEEPKWEMAFVISRTAVNPSFK